MPIYSLFLQQINYKSVVRVFKNTLTISIINDFGQTVYSSEFSCKEIYFWDIANLDSGIYNSQTIVLKTY